MPWDGSCSQGRGLHQACAKRIFSQIKCSSLVKFEHIPGTQDESASLPSLVAKLLQRQNFKTK